MKPQEIIETITELNDELFEINSDLYESGLNFEYFTNGYVDAVLFCNYRVYDSEDCDEEEIDKLGFKQYLIKERNEFIDMMNDIRKIRVS